MSFLKLLSSLMASCALAFCENGDVSIKLPPGGLLVEVPGHGNVIIKQAVSGSLTILIMPVSQIPNAGPSFSISRSEAYSEPELDWVVLHDAGRDYVTVRKSDREQLPTTILTYTYIDDVLHRIAVKKFEYTVRQEGVRNVVPK